MFTLRSLATGPFIYGVYAVESKISHSGKGGNVPESVVLICDNPYVSYCRNSFSNKAVIPSVVPPAQDQLAFSINISNTAIRIAVSMEKH